MTNGVHASDGEPLDTTAFRHDLNFGQTKDPALKAYRKSLLDGLSMARAVGVQYDDIAAASLFTTQTITAISNKIRAQIQAAAPEPVSFTLGTGGVRTVFPLDDHLSPVARQSGTSRPSSPIRPSSLAALSVFPGPIVSVAFGSYPSRDYETREQAIPAYGTATGTPAAQATNTLGLTLFAPAGREAGRRLAGRHLRPRLHRQPQRRAVGCRVVAREAGIASIAINVVGHGFGPPGTLHRSHAGGATGPVPAGGRAIDQNANGVFDSTEGVNAVAPQTLIGNRDGLRQTVIDFMQLVRLLQGGVDIDADGRRPQHVADLLRRPVVRRHLRRAAARRRACVRAGVVNVPGGPIIEIARLSPASGRSWGISLISRMPSLYNAAPNPSFTSFKENIPLRNEPIRVDTVPGASAIQQVID